jgi:hypothetical protein
MKITFHRTIDIEWKTITEEYRFKGLLHRDEDEGPARIISGLETGEPGWVEYRWHGLRHRYSGPALIVRYDNGIVAEEEYFHYGRFHRDPEEGPAWIRRTETGIVHHESYQFRDFGCRHPEDGPWDVTRCDKTGKLDDEQFLTLEELRDIPVPRRMKARIPGWRSSPSRFEHLRPKL